MAITIDVTGTYTLDESKGLQNTNVATATEDNNDNDVAISSLPSEFYDYLYGSGAGKLDLDSISASYLSYPTDNGVAGSSTSVSLIHVTSDSGNISTLGLTNATGGSFTGTAVAANDSGLTTTSGHQIYLLSASLNGVANQVVLGLYDSDNDASHTLDAVAFAVYMKPNGALDDDVNAQLWSVAFTPIDEPTNPNQDEAVDLLQNVFINSTGQLHIAFDNMPSSANLFNDAAESPSGGGIIVFGMHTHLTKGKYDNSSDTIQTSQGGDGATIGVNNQMFNPGEGAYFTYVKDIADPYLSGAKGGLSSTEADYAANMQYASLIDASTASIRITQTQGNNDAGMRITANHLSSKYTGSALLDHAGEGQVDIDKVYVWDSTHTNVLESYTGSGPDDDGGSDDITIAIVDGVATVTGLDDGNIVEWHTVSPQNQVLIEDVAGAWDLGGFDIKEGARTTVSAANHAFLEDDGPSTFNPVDITYDPNTPANNVKNQAGSSKLNVDLSDTSGKTLSDLVGTDGFKATDPLVFYDSNTANNLLQGTVGSGSLQNLTSGGSLIYLYGYGTSTLTASTDSDPTNGLDSTKTVFTIGLDATGDNYDFNMYGHIDNGSVNAFVDFAGQKQTIYDWLTLDLPNQLETSPPSPDDGDILFTGVERADVSDFNDDFLYRAGVNNTAINVSSKGIGVGSQSITVGKGVFIDFIDGAPRTLDGQAPIGDLDFTGHTLVDDSGFGISQLKPNTGTKTDVRVSIYKEDAANDPNNDGSYAPTDITDNQLINIDSITIQQVDATGHVIDSITVLAGVDDDRSLGGRTLNFEWGGTGDDDWVTITNLGTDYRVLVNGEQSYNQMLVENVGSGNEGFDVSGIVYHEVNAGAPVHMDFDVRLFDGDLDPTVASFGVTLAPPDIF